MNSNAEGTKTYTPYKHQPTEGNNGPVANEEGMTAPHRPNGWEDWENLSTSTFDRRKK